MRTDFSAEVDSFLKDRQGIFGGCDQKLAAITIEVLIRNHRHDAMAEAAYIVAGHGLENPELDVFARSAAREVQRQADDLVGL